MIGTSWWQYIFIRLCIAFLLYIIPLGAFSCVFLLWFEPFKHRIPIAIAIWAVCETLFLIFVLLYTRLYLQRPSVHPPPLPRHEREELFRLCVESVADPERYLSKWFKGAPASEIRRENVKQFFCWSFLNKSDYGLLDDEELEEYADELEKVLGRKLPPGTGNAVALRLTLDRVRLLYRPLLWYLIVSVIDALTHVYMRYQSFHFYRLALSRFLTVFPPRPLALLTTRTTPARTLSYWHRPHTSRSRLPVLFIHGIGIGLWTYAGFLAALNRIQDGQDGETGIIAIEIMPISFRLTHAALSRGEMMEEILKIVRYHGWTKFVLVAHSYGSVIATHLLRDPETAPLVGGLLLVDPVSVLLHLPDVAYNFTCRQPIGANEHQLYYFASMDMGVAHTLARGFFWQENILWKRDLRNRRATVVLCGKDLIVNTEAVGQYLACDEDEAESWKYDGWKGSGLDIMWYDDLDHSQVFERKQDYARLVEIVQNYTAISD